MAGKPRVMVLRAPGTNCDLETAHAFELAGATAERCHIQSVLAEPRRLREFQAICLPGGFSYGDDIAAGRILGNQLRHHLSDELRAFRDAGKVILGICNGFQILLKTGLLLPDDADGVPPATLGFNNSGKFEARWVALRVASSKSPILTGLECLELPVAHAEGKFVARTDAGLDALEAAGQVVLRYCDGDGRQASADALPYPANPNGAQRNIAGICDATGRVVGMMPHPERFVDLTQHPAWTRRRAKAEAAVGLAIFRNVVRCVA